MAPKRKYTRRRQRRSSEESPPARKAKIAAMGSISVQLSNRGTSSRPNSRSSEPTIVKVEEQPCAGHGPVEYNDSNMCAICFDKKEDPTELDKCSHSFCFRCASEWFKHSSSCPLCKKKVEVFWHRLVENRVAVTVSALQAAAEAERLAQRGQSQAPVDEQECIRLRIRRLRARLATVQQNMNDNSRGERLSELSKTHVRHVNEIAKLEMLKRDVTTRGELVGNIVFRSLIYKDKLEWRSVDRNVNRVPFSPEICRRNMPESAERLKEFLSRELHIVWRSRKVGESREEYVRKRNNTVDDIILWCSEMQINSPLFSRNLRYAGIYPSYTDRFQTELFEFASSMLSLRDFDRTSAYSSHELRQMLRRRNRRDDGTDEVVNLSDSDSEIIPLDDYPRPSQSGSHAALGEDVIVLSDDDPEYISGRPANAESNYIRDEPGSSTSEASYAGEFYARPACRLPRPGQAASGGRRLSVIDAFGHDLFNAIVHNELSSTADDPLSYNYYHGYFEPRNGNAHDATIATSREGNAEPPELLLERRRCAILSQWPFNSSLPLLNRNPWLSAVTLGHPASSSFVNVPGNQQESTPRLVEGSSRASSCSSIATLSPGSTQPQLSSESSERTKKTKSLFGPSVGQRNPTAPPKEVKGENKLLNALWEERQKRLKGVGEGPQNSEEINGTGAAANMTDSVITSTANGISVSPSMEEATLRHLRMASSGESLVGHEASAEVVTVVGTSNLSRLESSPSGQGSSDSKGRTRHHNKSWRRIFELFRRKESQEKCSRKRQKAYDFVMEMARKLENSKERESPSRDRDSSQDRACSSQKHVDHAREGDHGRYSSSR